MVDINNIINFITENIFIIVVGIIVLNIFIKLLSILFKGSETDDEEDEDEGDYETCFKCNTKINIDDEDYEEIECQECGEYFCKNCRIYLDSAEIILCKDCIKKYMPPEESKKSTGEFAMEFAKESIKEKPLNIKRKEDAIHKDEEICKKDDKEYLLETKFEDTKFD